MKHNYALSAFLLVIALTLSPMSTFSQVDVKWKKQLARTIQWQDVSPLGSLIISSGESLAALDTETGTEEIGWCSSKSEYVCNSIRQDVAFLMLRQYDNDSLHAYLNRFKTSVNTLKMIGNKDILCNAAINGVKWDYLY